MIALFCSEALVSLLLLCSEVSTITTSSAVTFRGNLARSRHGWLRLTPAYSVQLVERLIRGLPTRTRVLDPFCGTGTTLLTCAEQGLRCTTVDLNPFLVWLANAKASQYTQAEIDGQNRLATRMSQAISRRKFATPWLPPISNIDRWWDPETQWALGNAYAVLDRAREGPKKNLAAVSFCRALIACAHVSFGHQSMSFRRGQGQTKPGVGDALATAVRHVADSAGVSLVRPQATAVLGDARQIGKAVGGRRFDVVVTSPPYCNRMSYIRELRPYMYWLGHLDVPSSAGELDWKAIGGTWGVATSRLSKWQPSATVRGHDRKFRSGVTAIAERSPVLARYVERYFWDMAQHLSQLKQVLSKSAQLHYVVGNSKFYDVVLPTEQLLGQQMEEAGFSVEAIQKLRTRTSKSELAEFLVSARCP